MNVKKKLVVLKPEIIKKILEAGGKWVDFDNVIQYNKTFCTTLLVSVEKDGANHHKIYSPTSLYRQSYVVNENHIIDVETFDLPAGLFEW